MNRRNRSGNWFGWLIFLGVIMLMFNPQGLAGLFPILIVTAIGWTIFSNLRNMIEGNSTRSSREQASRNSRSWTTTSSPTWSDQRRPTQTETIDEVITRAAARQNERDPREVSARAAARRAGLSPQSPLKLGDVGLLLYENSTQAIIDRDDEISSTASHIRPFVVISIPASLASDQNMIRFNLVDEAGNLRYTHRGRYRLTAGENFVTPTTWLPTEAESVSGGWRLEVMFNDTALALHSFQWIAAGGEVRKQFNSDGEMTDMTTLLLNNQGAADSLSLDELLSSQSAPAAKADRRG